MSEKLYTPELAGSGQFGKCAKCGLNPTKEGHDGCLGELDVNVVMNACCGHGDDSMAYIQHWDGSCVRGNEAIREIEGIINERTRTKSN